MVATSVGIAAADNANGAELYGNGIPFCNGGSPPTAFDDGFANFHLNDSTGDLLVNVHLKGAVPNANYSVFIYLSPSCVGVAHANMTTNSNGCGSFRGTCDRRFFSSK